MGMKSGDTILVKRLIASIRSLEKEMAQLNERIGELEKAEGS